MVKASPKKGERDLKSQEQADKEKTGKNITKKRKMKP